MTQERAPRTTHDWLAVVREEGPSNRPVPANHSDLIEHDYSDPMGMKAERGALAAIVATRTYMRAKKHLLAQKDSLSLTALPITTPELLIEKNLFIGKVFKETMVNALRRDERLGKKLPDNNRVAKVYKRLEELNIPALNVSSADRQQGILNKAGRTGPLTGVFLNIFSGIDALPDNMDMLANHTVDAYVRKFHRRPDVPTMMRIMGNSYESVIEVLAKIHQAETAQLPIMEAGLQRQRHDPVVLQDDALHYTPEWYKALTGIRTETKKTRSRTTFCAFMTPTSEMLDFLDGEPDFKDPLRDAFNLHMELLAA